MSHEEALGLAQILLGLLLFTLGIPVLIMEISAQGQDVRHLLHKRFRHWPRNITVITLTFVAVLILRSGNGGEQGETEEVIAKMLVVVIVGGFAIAWINMIRMNMRSVLIRDIYRDLLTSLVKTGAPKDEDLKDLVTLGEHLAGEEKADVLLTIRTLCRDIQSRPDYNGTELEGPIRGLHRIIEPDGTDQHHAIGLRIITECWRNLPVDLRDDHDGDVILEVACLLAEAAVSKRSESIVERWVSAIPDVIALPYRIGRSAVRNARFRLVIAAFDSLSRLAETQKRLPREIVALIAQCVDAGPSAAAMAHGFLERLGYFGVEVRESAKEAAEEFREEADYASADAITRCFEL